MDYAKLPEPGVYAESTVESAGPSTEPAVGGRTRLARSLRRFGRALDSEFKGEVMEMNV